MAHHQMHQHTGNRTLRKREKIEKEAEKIFKKKNGGKFHNLMKTLIYTSWNLNEPEVGYTQRDPHMSTLQLNC